MWDMGKFVVGHVAVIVVAAVVVNIGAEILVLERRGLLVGYDGGWAGWVGDVRGNEPPTKSRYCGLKALVVCVGEIAVGLHADFAAKEDVNKAVGKVDLSNNVVGADVGRPDFANHRKSAAG